MKSKLEYRAKDSWYPCYTAWVYEKDIDIVISKLHGTWRVGIYRENIDWQPHPDRGGYVGAFKTLSKAKEIINDVLTNSDLNYYLKGGK